MKQIIKVSKYGETISSIFEGIDDSEKFDMRTILHDKCSGYIDFFIISDKFSCLHCRDCGLRVVFPSRIKTFGELREYFKTALDFESLYFI